MEKTEEKSILESYAENMRIMNSIVGEMKEIPVLPSEKPTDVQKLQKVEFPAEGGVLTYMEGFPLPYRGFPFYEFVDKIDILKKLSRGTISAIFHDIKGRKLSLLGVLFCPWIVKAFVRSQIYAFARFIERFRMKPYRYSRAVREVYRSLSVAYPNEDAKTAEVRKQIRDLVCMTLENDNAYRYRFQDLIVELDKNALEKNAEKEITRLLELMASREVTQEIKDTWTLVRFGMRFYFLIDRKMKKVIVNALTQIDMNAVQLTDEDKQYASPRKDYNFGFKVAETINNNG